MQGPSLGTEEAPAAMQTGIAWEDKQLCRAGAEVQNLLKMSQQCALEAMKAKTGQAASAERAATRCSLPERPPLGCSVVSTLGLPSKC